jgi:hypothetical protein
MNNLAVDTIIPYIKIYPLLEANLSKIIKDIFFEKVLMIYSFLVIHNAITFLTHFFKPW